MPPKKKAASICDLCCRPIVDSKEDCIQCEGQCRLTFHRYCAGVSATHYKQFISTNRPFVCMVCNQQLQNERVSQLAAELESLKAELTATKEQLARERLPCENCSPASSSDSETEQQPKGSTNAALQSNAEWSSVMKKKAKTKPSITPKSASYPERAKLVSPEERKFNVIIYGIKECKKGTPRHVRMNHDMKSVSEIIKSICPDITCQAIRDSVRLGRYTESRNRPLLAKLNRSCDVLSILARLLEYLLNPTSPPMKGPLKLLCYVKGGYLSNRAQTKKILQFVETAFSSESQNMAQPMLPTSSFIPLSFLQTQRKPMTTLYSQT